MYTLTRQEAIEILKHEKDNDIFVCTEWRNKIHEALSIAASDMKKLDRIEDIMHIEMNGKEALQEIERILRE